MLFSVLFSFAASCKYLFCSSFVFAKVACNLKYCSCLAAFFLRPPRLGLTSVVAVDCFLLSILVLYSSMESFRGPGVYSGITLSLLFDDGTYGSIVTPAGYNVRLAVFRSTCFSSFLKMASNALSNVVMLFLKFDNFPCECLVQRSHGRHVMIPKTERWIFPGPLV